MPLYSMDNSGGRIIPSSSFSRFRPLLPNGIPPTSKSQPSSVFTTAQASCPDAEYFSTMEPQNSAYGQQKEQSTYSDKDSDGSFYGSGGIAPVSFFEESFQNPCKIPTSNTDNSTTFQHSDLPSNFLQANAQNAASVEESGNPGFRTSLSTLSPVNHQSSLPTAGIQLLYEHIDASKFEDVRPGDWAPCAPNYEGSSPSSVNTGFSGPLTPNNANGREHFHRSSWGTLTSTPRELQPRNAPPMEELSNPNSSGMIAPSSFSQSFTSSCSTTSEGTGISPEQYLPAWKTSQVLDSRYDSEICFVPSAPAYPMPSYQGFTHGSSFQPLFPSSGYHPAMSSTAGPIQPFGAYRMGPIQHVSGAETTRSLPMMECPVTRYSRDRYILEMRRQGLSYREIKRRGGFHEAESTLRGRVRMITKPVSERVRRPGWTDHDVSQSPKQSTSKLPF